MSDPWVIKTWISYLDKNWRIYKIVSRSHAIKWFLSLSYQGISCLSPDTKSRCVDTRPLAPLHDILPELSQTLAGDCGVLTNLVVGTGRSCWNTIALSKLDLTPHTYHSIWQGWQKCGTKMMKNVAKHVTWCSLFDGEISKCLKVLWKENSKLIENFVFSENTQTWQGMLKCQMEGQCQWNEECLVLPHIRFECWRERVMSSEVWHQSRASNILTIF